MEAGPPGIRIPPPLFALVELYGDAAQEAQEAMVAHACRMSRAGRVVVVLNGVEREDADALLRRVALVEAVDPARLEIAEWDAVGSLLESVTRAPIIAPATEALRVAIAAAGIPLRRRRASAPLPG
jgi:hypothetical protein